MAQAPHGGQDPLVVRHDRARRRLVRRDQHPHLDRPRREDERDRHQRPQVVDLGRRRPAQQGPPRHGQVVRRPRSSHLFLALDRRTDARRRLQGPEGEQVQAAEHRHRPERHPGRQARPPDAGRASSSLFPSPCRPPRCSCGFVAQARVDLQSDPTDSSPSCSSPRSSATTTRPRATTRSCTRTFASRRRT